MCEIIGCICNLIKSIWNWLELNVSTLKDVFGIICTVVATVVGYKTYKRARYTLLQPVKTELLKKQTDLYVELLDFLGGDTSLYINLDYIGICVLNLLRMIEDYDIPNFGLNNKDEIAAMEGGFVLLNDTENKAQEISVKSLESIEDVENRIIREKNLKKEDIELLLKGSAKLRKIYLTTKHIECMNELEYFAKNPFLPKEITEMLSKIEKDIEYNIHKIAKKHFQKFLIDLYFSDSSPDKPMKFDGFALYNEFCDVSIKHEIEVEEIRKVIREKLLVDVEWTA